MKGKEEGNGFITSYPRIGIITSWVLVTRNDERPGGGEGLHAWGVGTHSNQLTGAGMGRDSFKSM
jgi:hypothetical protein